MMQLEMYLSHFRPYSSSDRLLMVITSGRDVGVDQMSMQWGQRQSGADYTGTCDERMGGERERCAIFPAPSRIRERCSISTPALDFSTGQFGAS